jgi:nucleoside-diphosphate-sugar epimerase
MEKIETNKRVLVTGGSGFIAVNCIVKLLKRGYAVRTTLRSLNRENEVKDMLKNGGIVSFDNLSFIEANLSDDKNWNEAVKGCEYILHIASPTPATGPGSTDEMVKMAVDGVLNVFKAAKKSGVKRIVLTSASGAAIAGHKNHPEIFTEKDWTNLNAPINAYQRSKTRAEQEAWKFANENDMELASILPVAVMGPVLGKDFSHSNQAIKNMLEGKMKSILRLGFDYVDVRDVADLHILAMESTEAAGERFLATAGKNLTYKQLAELLKKHFGAQADKVSTREIPDFVVKFAAHFIKDLKMPATFLGQNTACSNEKARKMLGWQPCSAEDAIVATAESLIKLGIVK